MFNFFKKKQEIKKPVKKETKGTPFDIDRHKADLQALYDSVVGRGAKPYTPVKATLKVVDAGSSDDGFAADYASVYRVKEIVSIEKFK